MRITDLLELDSIVVPLASNSKENVINDLTAVLAKKQGWGKPAQIAAEVIRREIRFQTDFRPSLAFPHASSEGVARKCMAIGKLEKPIPWHGPSGQSVDVVFLLLAPKDQFVSEVLIVLAGLFENHTTRKLLLQCDRPEAIYNFMVQVGIDLERPDGFSLLRFFEGHPDVIQTLAWKPDGSRLASSSRGTDHAIRIWDTSTEGKTSLRSQLLGHRAPVNSLVWSKDGQQLASGGEDKSIRIWRPDMTHPEEHCKIIDADVEVHGLAFSHSGGTLAAALHLRGVRVYDVDSCRPVGTLAGDPTAPFEPALSVTWSYNNDLIAAGGGRLAPCVRVWRGSDPFNLVKSLPLRDGHVPTLAWSPNGDLLCAGLPDGSIAVWNSNDWSQHTILKHQSLGITCLDFSYRGDYLASKSGDGTVCVWDTSSWKSVATLLDYDTYQRVYAPIAFHPNDLSVATLGGQGRSIRVWRMAPRDFSIAPKTQTTEKAAPKMSDSSFSVGRNVFVVHGHDNEAKLEMARFLESEGLKPIILHEQPDGGHTIIEKFEAHTDVSFAVIILTPDDNCIRAGEKQEPVFRARQNVILEMGYFLGKLGRDKVRVMYKPPTELPSDYHGVIYKVLDPHGAWKMGLLKELQSAGIPTHSRLMST